MRGKQQSFCWCRPQKCFHKSSTNLIHGEEFAGFIGLCSCGYFFGSLGLRARSVCYWATIVLSVLFSSSCWGNAMYRVCFAATAFSCFPRYWRKLSGRHCKLFGTSLAQGLVSKHVLVLSHFFKHERRER